LPAPKHGCGAGYTRRAPTACPTPHCKGAYILALHLPEPATLPVLGGLALDPGVYVYVGSALGPGGLAARLARHLQGRGRPHWHVDRLRAASRPLGYAACCTPERVEEALARECTSQLDPGPRGFGASDSRAETHLFRAPPGWARPVEDCLARVCGHSISCELEAPGEGPGEHVW